MLKFGLVKPTMSHFAQSIYEQKYAWKDEAGNVTETWEDTAERVTSNVLGALDYSPGDPEYDKILTFIAEKKFIPGGRYLYASGRGLHQTQNCLLLRAEDSREGWADLMRKASMALMTGAGIGVDYSDVRPSGTEIKKTGGTASGPISLIKILNEIGRNVMQGGSRRSAIWAGLNWKHQDIFEFIRMKDWSPEVRAMKEKDFSFPATADMTNISVLLDDEFFQAFQDDDPHARQVYWLTIQKMLKTGEPGFSIDVGENAGETLRNACTEVTSYDDSDICNLGSVNMSRINSMDEFEEVVRCATLFLIAGTVYSDLPYEEVYEVRAKNRRLGLGLMGIHEWLVQRDYLYAPCSELADWGEIYQKSGEFANEWADKHGLSRPLKTRAIAPNGTISIIGETTSGIEPIFCVAYKRRYKTAQATGKDLTNYQYVIDPTARRLVDSGVHPETLEDAYTLATDVERRIKFQAFMQQYVDHGISSTINLPAPITDEGDIVAFGVTLFKYLPNLRGVTVYPDGARHGQPLTPISYDVAVNHEGVEYLEDEEKCAGGICSL